MPTYVIIRHGSNAANQSMCERAAICKVQAKDRAAALEKADVQCYANQYLEAVPAGALGRTAEGRAMIEDAERGDILEKGACMACGKELTRTRAEWDASPVCLACENNPPTND